MPSEHIITAIHDQSQSDPAQDQVKRCSSCHSPLSTDPAYTSFILQDGQDSNDTSIVCGPCRTRLLAQRIETPVLPTDILFAQVERELLRRAASLQDAGNEAHERRSVTPHHPNHTTDEPCLDEEMDIEASGRFPLLPSSAGSQNLTSRTPAVDGPSQAPRSPAPTRVPLTIALNNATPTQYPTSTPAIRPSSSLASTSRPRYHERHAPAPDPFVDITRIRVRSQGHHCLYPGAVFQGTQKSGRNNYDVNVTIVDVDFSSSHLCGYLRIRGLTDDWPELTTYFDAEIIGSRYGFLTRNWGATEQEDMVHWARFPTFRHVRHELKKPQLTMKDADRGAVFMRWKEKFLVPDHRVQDINGASFAGFYYVCVDFNPQQTGSLASPATQQPSLSSSPEDAISSSPTSQSSSTVKPELSPRARRESVNRGARRLGRSSSRGAPSSNVATMSGFYFHQNSEPYQQLSLVHVPERTSSCFEFR